MAPLLIVLADKVPSDNKVVAGWGGFAMFVALCVAVALLGMSLVKHLRRARENFGVADTTELKDSPKRLDAQELRRADSDGSNAPKS